MRDKLDTKSLKKYIHAYILYVVLTLVNENKEYLTIFALISKSVHKLDVDNAIDILSIEELREACKYLFNMYPEEYYTETNSKRCILCLDYKENYCE